MEGDGFVAHGIIAIDDEAIGRAAANFFAANGDYAAFGFVGARHGLAWSRDRGAFFAKELRRLGRRGVRIFHGGRDWERALAAWLRGLPRPAAVFAANDLCADGVLKAAAGDIPVTVIGDAVRPGKVDGATRGGYMAAIEL